ncbi:MAG: hypothetical protein JW782_06080 [Candidatus Saganbacteria bacterium]|nr:hypothetical protein [Candidatus Saganbacteria bacterium]
MIRIIALLLIMILGSQAGAIELARDTLWFGRVNLTQEVVVPENVTLTIAPGTKITTNGNKIIAYGKVAIQADETQPVDLKYFPQTETSTVEVVRLKPYDVDTDILKEEFNVFKVQYAILWSLLFASTFVMLEAR